MRCGSSETRAAIPSTRKLELDLAACASGPRAIQTFADAHVARVMHEDPDALEHGRTMRRVLTLVLGRPVGLPPADALDAADALMRTRLVLGSPTPVS
ncbi:hypothetical protein PsorP6_015646 [Peronosclerospora sorghi]|uniref:Uncharacterized protein n=1 Tax=Peronosclerospora sorghi TaxID=230839 RepID=A0ACC0WNG4_9STRA|nr:hypothetical protein PsorP6_015646 [Peronosclerospora sorghi]